MSIGRLIILCFVTISSRSYGARNLSEVEFYISRGSHGLFDLYLTKNLFSGQDPSTVMSWGPLSIDKNQHHCFWTSPLSSLLQDRCWKSISKKQSKSLLQLGIISFDFPTTIRSFEYFSLSNAQSSPFYLASLVPLVNSILRPGVGRLGIIGVWNSQCLSRRLRQCIFIRGSRWR